MVCTLWMHFHVSVQERREKERVIKRAHLPPLSLLVDMFYDLNLGVDGVGDQSRREMVAMAMQLGYSGVAANRTFTGIMADSDRCKLRPLELRTLLAAAPGVAEAAKFHQGVLGVPPGLPFRQFTRITVVVDNPSQANALNSGNPVLKSYDLVAVRPTNQKSFNQACSQLEVDLISLDAGQKLPFRLKIPMVKAAIERGLYFEVTYGSTISDPKARRELFANAQMLQAAAHGRNIIVSSGARRALELRGPNDVANMSTIFGLTLEFAKRAVSNNCKAVLMHGVMRKATYRAAIHIERITTERSLDAIDTFTVPTDWDPLSLGGASADFVPMEDGTDVVAKDLLLHSKIGHSKENTNSGTEVQDVIAAVASPELNIREISHESSAMSKTEAQKEESTLISNRSVTVRKGNRELNLTRGLIISTKPSNLKVDDEFGAKDKMGSLPTEIGKQASNGNLQKKVDLSVEKLGLSKGKRRKRKR